MNKLYIILFVISIIISSYSQIMLKQGSKKEHIYLNKYTIIGYSMMIISTLCTLIAYKGINLSLGQILQSLSYIFVIILSRLILKEQINKKQIVGVIVILIGIFIFNM